MAETVWKLIGFQTGKQVGFLTGEGEASGDGLRSQGFKIILWPLAGLPR
jgi:hypothetical protein